MKYILRYDTYSDYIAQWNENSVLNIPILIGYNDQQNTKRVNFKSIDYFYVQHSSSGKIQRIKITDSIDWPSLVDSNHIYGGLYSEWAGNGDYAKLISEGNARKVKFTNNEVQDINYVQYDGNVFNASNRLAKTNAYKSIQIPEKNTIYYLCEPIKPFFNTHCIYSYSNNIITNLYLFISLDTNNYASVSTKLIDTSENELEYNVTVSNSLSINGTKYTVSTLDPQLSRGYLGTLSINKSDLQENTYYTIEYNAQTPDGYDIECRKLYIYTADFNINNFILNDTPIN